VIKSQVLPDFTAEWLELQNTGPPDLSSVWTMYFDGLKRIQGAGAGVVLISPQGDKLKYVLRMSFSQASNNEAKFDGCKVSHVSGASNEEADNLANIGSQCLPIPQGVFWEEIIERSIKSNKPLTAEEQGQHQATGSGTRKTSTTEPEEIMMIEETWMQPYLTYMVNKTLLEDTVQAKRII
jgi:hypothetical protein